MRIKYDRAGFRGYLCVEQRESFNSVQGNDDLHEELLVFSLQRQSKAIDDTVIIKTATDLTVTIR